MVEDEHYNLKSFTDILDDEICDSQPISLPSSCESAAPVQNVTTTGIVAKRPAKRTGQYAQFRSIDEIDPKYRSVFSYPFFNLVQSSVIEDALYSDKSMVVCAPTGSGKTVVFEMTIVQLLMEMEDKSNTEDFKIIYMAPVKALCTERLTEWYPKFTKLGLLCIEVTGDTDVDFSMLKPYKIIITTPEKWDMLTRRWRDHRSLVEVIKLFLIDEVHILNDEARGPVLEAVVSRMKTIESSAQSAHRIELLQRQYQGSEVSSRVAPPRIRFAAVSATVSNPEDVAAWLTADKPAVYHKFGDECRPVKLKRVVEGYPCPEGTSIFKFDIILNYKLWSIIQKYHNGKPTLIFCNTRKSVALTAETLSREITISFNPEQKAKLTALASTIKNKKLQSLVMNGVGCHHAGLLFEERANIELAFRNRDLPILITTTTLAMGVNLPAHLVIIKNTQQYVNGSYQEYSISTVLQMVGRAGRPQFDTEATAVIMTRLNDKHRYQALVGGSEPLQSYLHKRLPENLNSEAALGTVTDVAQCVQWLRSTFLFVRAARDPKRYLGLPPAAPQHLISKKIEELCVKAMNGLATSGLITMDEASCIQSTAAGQLMSIYYLDLETMKHIMKINGTESLERLLCIVCESHELADMHLRVDERRSLNALNRNHSAATIRFPMKGKITTRQMKVNCIIQAILGCLPIPDPSLNQEAMKIMRIADRVCKCLVAYVTRTDLISQTPQYFAAVLNSLILAKCVASHLWENSPFVSKQLKGIGPTFSTLLATAGKGNFMLLEESHPRDLERIMNKGPPAGNILRKQISLLPKYQLIMMPIDENSVSIQLTLLNQSYLSENMDHLTAGDSHKSYIVVGDSDNHLLLLTSFKDKDLISVYDGSITYTIKRKHCFEHKVSAHCLSSSFVGIDAQSDYLFKDLEGADNNKQTTNSPAMKQTCITDTFQHRKRKNSDTEISQSKEKKKRDSALMEKLKYLKESFGKASKELKEGLNKSTDMSNKILQDLNADKPSISDKVTLGITDKSIPNQFIENYSFDNFTVEELNEEDFINDEKIDCILNEIESEISKDISKPEVLQVNSNKLYADKKPPVYNSYSKSINSVSQNISNKKAECYKIFKEKRNRKTMNSKSNYNFIDLLERNIDFSDEENTVAINKENGFTDTIKSQVERYLEETRNSAKVPDITIKELLQDKDETETSRVKIEVSKNQGNINLVRNIDDESKIVHIDRSDGLKTGSTPIVCEKVCGTVNLKDDIAIDSKSNINIPYTSDVDNLVRDSGLITPPYVKHKVIQETFAAPNKFLPGYDIYEKKQLPSLEVAENTETKEMGISPPKPKIILPSKPVVSQQKGDRLLNKNWPTNQTNNKSEYVKKYSYTATKIDVCTKDMTDHKVKVIRKLTIDLDITEIVSREDTKFTNKTFKVQETDHIGNNNTRKEMKCINFDVQDSIRYGSSHDHNVSINKTKLMLLPYNATSGDTKDFNEEKEATEKSNTFDKMGQIGGEKIISENSKNDNIENILQKYSKVLQKSHPNDVFPVHCDTKFNTDKIKNINASEEKAKRLFNIADIDSVAAPFETLINETHSKPYNPAVIPKYARNTVEERHEEIDINIPVNFPIHKHECKSPIPINLNLDAELNEYNIDQTMFNPQTLLQCFSSDDPYDVVPPPPQFRDANPSRYSSDCTQDAEDSIALTDYFDSNQWSENSKISSEMGYDKNIFEDYHDVELTPSKEIETWALSREDTMDNFCALNQIQSFTVMHKSSPTNNLLSTKSASPKVELSKFKFNHKNKLKLKM